MCSPKRYAVALEVLSGPDNSKILGGIAKELDIGITIMGGQTSVSFVKT